MDLTIRSGERGLTVRMLRRASWEEWTEYRLEWGIPGTGRGYTFPCDAGGNVTPGNDGARENLRALEAGEHPEYRALGVRAYERSCKVASIGICDVCGREVELDHYMTNTCECGAEYNGSGQRLADRSQWGEETGEHPCDVANYNPSIYR